MSVPSDPRAFRPTAVRAPHAATELQIDWADGVTTRYDHRTLRGLCPCASCQGHQGAIRWVPGTDELSESALELRSLEQVGNYALALAWGDGHDTGIYTYRYLRELGSLHGLTPDALRTEAVPRR